MASTAIKLDNSIIEQAKVYGSVENRSAPKQVEYWAKIGKVAQDNPDLTFNDINEILLSLAQVEAGNTTAYKFG